MQRGLRRSCQLRSQGLMGRHGIRQGRTADPAFLDRIACIQRRHEPTRLAAAARPGLGRIIWIAMRGRKLSRTVLALLIGAQFIGAQCNPEMRKPNFVLPDNDAQLLDTLCQSQLFGLGLKGFDLLLYLFQRPANYSSPSYCPNTAWRPEPFGTLGRHHSKLYVFSRT